MGHPCTSCGITAIRRTPLFGNKRPRRLSKIHKHNNNSKNNTHNNNNNNNNWWIAGVSIFLAVFSSFIAALLPSLCTTLCIPFTSSSPRQHHHAVVRVKNHHHNHEANKNNIATTSTARNVHITGNTNSTAVVWKDRLCLTLECFEKEARALARAFPNRPKESWCVPRRAQGSSSLLVINNVVTANGNITSSTVTTTINNIINETAIKNATQQQQQQQQQKWQSLLLVRPFKAASSTSAGVALRMAHRAILPGSGGCAVRYQHTGHDYLFHNRLQHRSFLWAPVRRAAARAYSEAFFFKPSPTGFKSDDEVIRLLQSYSRRWKGGMIYNFLLGVEPFASNFSKMLKNEPQEENDSSAAGGAASIHSIIGTLIQEFDFLLVAERFDESVTVLALLTGLDVGDVLVRSSKVAGRISTNQSSKNNSTFSKPKQDDTSNPQEQATPPQKLPPPRYTRKGGLCFLHRQMLMSDAVKRYTTEDDEWLYWNYADEILWRAANFSLDMTIERLGRARFEQALQEYLTLKTRVERECPEPPGCIPGKPQPKVQEGCYREDFGCGFECVDDVINKMKREAQ